LGQQKKCDDVLTKLINLNPSIILFQETKLNEIPLLKAKKFLPHHLTNFHFKPSNGSAGGILTAPSSNHFSLQQKNEKELSLTSTITSLMNNQQLLITNVYTPTDPTLKVDFLSELERH
jgi:exonuclease III